MYCPFYELMHIKVPLLLIGIGTQGCFSGYLSGPLPNVPRHITVNKMC